jgi:hypothetical protein
MSSQKRLIRLPRPKMHNALGLCLLHSGRQNSSVAGSSQRHLFGKEARVSQIAPHVLKEKSRVAKHAIVLQPVRQSFCGSPTNYTVQMPGQVMVDRHVAVPALGLGMFSPGASCRSPARLCVKRRKH